MFAVIWYGSPLDALADSYVAADLPTRDVIEKAVVRFNVKLAVEPEALGESRPGQGRRIAFDKPCAIRYTVDLTDRVVRVTDFWIY